jgi:NAD(P)H-dependent FMN reductase
MPSLGVVVGSVRKGRIGQPVAEWFVQRVRAHGGFDPTLIDLEDVDLPMLETPHHPRLQKYEDDKTKAWSALVKGIDAFVFVTPEYNHFAAPALVNALDSVYVEWNYKACGFVSYGGPAGGARSAVMTRILVTSLKMMPMFESVLIPLAAQMIKDGRFAATEPLEKAATVMLDELKKWDGALASLRSV